MASSSALEAPLPVDPELEIIRLGNGFTVILRPCRQPPPRVAMWLVVRCGSLHEEEDERGMAHFVEHLAFRGSRHFEPGGIETSLAALGLASGRQVNAFTATVDTTYRLLLPGPDDGALDTGLTCLADIAWGLALGEGEVERERRVILEEVRADRGAEERVRERVLRLLAPGARLAERHPFGLERTVAAATPERLRSFYRRWYRPDTSTLLVVGDVDRQRVVTLAEERFGGWAEGEPVPAPDPGLGRPAPTRGGVVLDPELTETEVQVVSVWPSAPAERVGDLRVTLLEDLGLFVLNRRLAERSAGETGSCSAVAATIAPLLSSGTQARVVASCATGKVAECLAALLEEVHRLRLHAPLEAELEEARSAARARALDAARGEQYRDPETVVQEVHAALRAGRLPLSPVQRRDLLEHLLPGVEGAEVAASLARRFDPQHRLLLVVGSGGEGCEMPTEDDLLRLHASVLSRDPGPPARASRPEALLSPRPSMGTLVGRDEVAEAGVVSATLGNGVLVHLRPMDRQPGRILVHVGLAGGRISETLDDLGLTAAGATVFAMPACRRHPSASFRSVLSARTVDLSGWVDEDLVSVRLSASSEDLEVALEVLHLLLGEPRIEPHVLARWQHQVARHDLDHQSSVESSLAAAAVSLLTADDHRFRALSTQQAAAISLERAQEWVEGMAGSMPLEAAIVGDLDADRMLELARWSLGSLPARPRRAPGLELLRALAVTDGAAELSVAVPTLTPRAAVLVGWRSAPWGERRERRLLRFAERILQQRLHRSLRQVDGLTYSAQCSYSPSRAFPAAAMLAVACAVPPGRTGEAVDRIGEVVAEQARVGPGAAELEAVRRQLLDLVEAARCSPQYWATHLSDLAYRGSSVSDLTEAGELYRTCTAEQVREALARWVVPEHRLVVVCHPA